MSDSLTSHSQRTRGRRPPVNPGGEQSTSFALASDFDDWDCNYKLQGGRLISTNVYSGGQSNTQSPPKTSTRIRTLAVPSPDPTAPTIRAHSLPSEISKPSPSEIQKISIRHDPEPIIQVVDAQNDKEFLRGLQSHDISAFDEHLFIGNTRRNDLRLNLWREQIAQEFQLPLLQPIPQPRRKKNVSELATIDQVLREIYPGDNPTEDSSTTVTVIPGSEIKKEMSIDGSMDNVRLCSQDGGASYLFSPQTISLSRSFVNIMGEDGFDGEIILTEDTETVELLGAWMSRDLDFEITIDNCDELMRIARKYQIPRLEKDIIPYLYNLPLHPCDAFTYGKMYSIPLLARQNVTYIFDHFSEYVDTHFKKLIISSPDCAVDLVKQYLKYKENRPSIVKEELISNKFRAWLAADTSVG